MDYFDSRDRYPELERLKVEIDLGKSEIRKFYAGANIFITGGAGFLGRLLIEKIARSCANFGNIYLLLRPKRGCSPYQRLESIFEDEVFDIVKKENPGFIEKMHVMDGDLAEPVCGLSQENQRVLREEVNLVFHVAACMRMAEPLMTAYTMNVSASKDLLDLATTMKQLKGFIYVSTAYSNCLRPDIGEKFYKPTYDWKDLQDLAKSSSEHQMSYLSPKLFSDSVNTYTFTKAVTEDMIQMYVGKIPVAIVRPSIVAGCANQPKTGWINNAYGVTGVVAGSSVGLIRVWYADPNKVTDIIPADYVINVLIAVPWQINRRFNARDQNDPPIYNVVSSVKAPLTGKEFTSQCSEAGLDAKVTTKKVIGEYFLKYCKYKWTFYLCVYLLHLSQGLVIDTALWLRGKEPRLMKAYQKIMNFNLHVGFFCERQWKYEQHNVDSLLREMNEHDRKLFPIDMTGFNWKEYCSNATRAVYRYILKCPDDVEDPTEAVVLYDRFVNGRRIIVGTLTAVAFYFFAKLTGRAVLKVI